MTRLLHRMSIKQWLLVALGVLAVVAFFLYANASGLFLSRLAAPSGKPVVKPVPDNWQVAQQEREQQIQKHLADHQENFDHFANFPVSHSQGIPLIVLKLLPKIAPEFWGSEDNFLSVMGLFNDERLVGYPFPRGIGFTGLTRENLNSDIDYASFTCGGCHIGRMRLESGKYLYLNGGVNQEFNVVGYRQRIVQTLNKVYDGATDKEQKKTKVIQAFLQALDTVEKNNPTYFYNNYAYQDRHFDKSYEAKQIALFREKADRVIPEFVAHQEQVYQGWQQITQRFYPKIAERIDSGFAGMEDAFGFNAAKAYQNLLAKPLTKPFAPLALPGSHGITDIMVVWDQDSHDPRWDDQKKRLINGGGQWSGHIPLPMYKNLAAQITLGFNDIDVSVSAHAEKLLQFLPPPRYPFNVDIELAKEGQALFAENCAECHQPNNGRVYRHMGTDMGRALVAGTVITVGAQFGFTADCSPTTTVEMGGQTVTPCSEYRGVSLKNKRQLALTPPRVHNGYNALPLPGLWAQAPYLHNGSVPTLYHLLMPNERPAQFIKSRLDYDAKHVGFRWAMDDWDQSEGYIFDTASSPSISNRGHDKDITMDGKTFKLDWSDEPQKAWALIEYLKTL